MQAWCDKVGWCPEEVDETIDGSFVLAYGSLHPQVDETIDGEVSGRNSGHGYIQVRADGRARGQLDYLWIVAAHELGHYCTDHLSTGLMAAEHTVGADPLEIDDAAAEAWRAGCP